MTILLAAPALYGAGLAASLSPCVLPLVPGYVGVLCDVAPGPPIESAAATRHVATARVLSFAAGAMLTFAALGAVVGALGWGAAGSGEWAQRIAGAVLVVLAVLLVAGRAGRIGTEVRLAARAPAQPHLRAFVLGVGCGAAWTPCAGPLLGAALTVAGTTGHVGRSTLLLVAYAAGVLTPFVALAVVGQTRLPAWVRRQGGYLGLVNAVLLGLVGVALVTGWYGSVIARLGVLG